MAVKTPGCECKGKAGAPHEVYGHFPFRELPTSDSGSSFPSHAYRHPDSASTFTQLTQSLSVSINPEDNLQSFHSSEVRTSPDVPIASQQHCFVGRAFPAAPKLNAPHASSPGSPAACSPAGPPRQPAQQPARQPARHAILPPPACHTSLPNSLQPACGSLWRPLAASGGLLACRSILPCQVLGYKLGGPGSTVGDLMQIGLPDPNLSPAWRVQLVNWNEARPATAGAGRKQDQEEQKLVSPSA